MYARRRVIRTRLSPVPGWHSGAVQQPVTQRTEIRDPRVMRALAHPARLAILESMYAGHSGTATEFAQVCGLSPSATSYHLRALAKVGLVEEAPGRGDGRERVWRTALTAGIAVNTGPKAPPDAQRAERELVDVLLAYQEARARAWLGRSADESAQWYEAATIRETLLLVTAAELTALNEELTTRLRRYSVHNRQGQAPPDARTVAVTYRAFPVEPANVKE